MCFGVSRRGSNGSLSKRAPSTGRISKNADLAQRAPSARAGIPDYFHECAQTFFSCTWNRQCLLVILKHATVRQTVASGNVKFRSAKC